MERLKDFDLPWYIKEDLIDLLEKHPDLFEMSADELEKLGCEKYGEAQYHSERAARFEIEGDAIKRYHMAKYGEKGE